MFFLYTEFSSLVSPSIPSVGHSISHILFPVRYRNRYSNASQEISSTLVERTIPWQKSAAFSISLFVLPNADPSLGCRWTSSPIYFPLRSLHKSMPRIFTISNLTFPEFQNKMERRECGSQSNRPVCVFEIMHHRYLISLYESCKFYYCDY